MEDEKNAITDEILLLNGKCLKEYNYVDVKNHIQECIHFGYIYLHVKTLLPGTIVPEINFVEDAYNISVQRDLAELADTYANSNYHSNDMTKLSSDEEKTKKENVVDTPGNLPDERKRVLPLEENSRLSGKPYIEGAKSQSLGMTLTEDQEMNGYSDSKRKQVGIPSNRGSSEIPLIENVNKQTRLVYTPKTGSLNSLNNSQYVNVDSFQNPYEMEDRGPHREMAVDCPENFIGTVKSTPRYPPPSSTPTKPKISSPQQSASNSRENLSNEAIYKNTNTLPQRLPTQEELQRAQMHQEYLNKRKEEEARLERENEFLRKSLRESQRLRALESKQVSKPPTGYVNTGFTEDATDSKLPVTSNQSSKQEYMTKNINVVDLIGFLQQSENYFENQPDMKKDLYQLSVLFHNPRFQTAVKIHNKVIASSSCKSVSNASYQHLLRILDLRDHCTDTTCIELFNIINEPNFQSLLKVHDQLSGNPRFSEDKETKDYSFKQYGEGAVRIIHLEKTSEPLGATVKNEGESVIIARIVKGGAADKSGLLHEGDEILEINQHTMKGQNVDDVSELMANLTGTITFMVVPGNNPYHILSTNNNAMCIRALFNYEPEEDDYIPCRELGISFLKGDILHVIDQEDMHWWQAYKDKDQQENAMAGLIPSKLFQEMRESLKQALLHDAKENKKGRSCICSKKNAKKKKKGLYNLTAREDNDEILTYEEVAQYLPQPHRKRPIVLIGPPRVGRVDLRERLMATDYNRFAAAVPHTSRSKKTGEHDGKDYHFVTRNEFNYDISQNKFLEYGEYEKNYYGTSLEAVRQVINCGQICILNLHPEALKIIKESNLKPYVVFIRPPNLETLRLNLQQQQQELTENQLKEIIERAREMEEVYGHYFDHIIVNSNQSRTYDELLMEINRLEVEPQWVPISWLDG
ncbi:MAGUK p55 subfamily member 5-like isoform X1 [Octopus sinensis]|uniref:MAGUK p55 subfamily member 5-like isoform X1 n=1 Tax=Octopus sinensis TaxID=2607531 RepID=A0A7E6F5Y3_9MOLL|nr:MAGUK p55 subfamily member 5-like isoform X1 [Octopus sinensis]